ncbi:VirB4 family type IV secretion/conjugal transfer ATPase [Methylosarcina fibrata]|uniref:VirB4 family type IV secretion/conjugal transfer ATPase n=1 Tax=Methylosarcina fibrata TaxID=105972 RepID=UPI0003826A64|nr:VirB4 family type IV secretion/conjugal transfer ATPase [Methylosarcina fibrata]
MYVQSIAIITAVLAAALLGILIARLRAVDKHLRLGKYRSHDAGLADLLNASAVVADGIIVGKNGSLSAAWMYEGEDNASSTNEQREALSARINQALARLGSGWMIHIDAIRRAAPNYIERGMSHFPDPVTAAIDEERRRTFESAGEMFESSFVLTLTWLPPIQAEKKFIELLFDDDSEPPNEKQQTRNLITQFERECTNLEDRLSIALKLHRLKSRKIEEEDGRRITYDDFLSHLQNCITGVNHPVVLPSHPLYLDAVIGGQELWGGVVPKIGRKYIQCVAIDGFPLESYPGILTALAELPAQYRWSNRFIFLNTHEAVSHLNKFRRKWNQKVRGFFDQVFNTGSGQIDQDAFNMVQDADAALGEINSGLVGTGYYTSVVVLLDADRAAVEASARQIAKVIEGFGFVSRIETINTLEAYLGSIPGHGYENVRRPHINTMNLADLIPTSTIWTGENAAPCPFYPPLSPALMHCRTTGNAPFRLNFHVRDVGHGIVFGPTGAGKSTFLGLTVASFLRYRDMSVFAFDKGMSMYALCKAAGGQHYEVAADDSKLAFCPLQHLETAGDRSWAMEWIDTILALNGLHTSPGQRNEIGNAIMSMWKNGDKTITDFCTSIQDISIREALKQYTIEGSMGHLLDADQDGLALSRFTTFEIEELMGLGEKYGLPVLLYLFRRIERALHGQPAVIILDEAWIMLGNPVFREKIREWLKVLRKANCAVIMATQSLTDAAGSGILDVILEATATKIFLPNIYARDEDTAALYARMGLNRRQIDIIAGAIPKRHYYVVSEKGRRLVELALGPLALSFVGVSDKDAVAGIKELERRHGERWVKEWLRNRNLAIDDYIEHDYMGEAA